MNPRRRQNSLRGFTLIETLVVLLIMGLLVGLVSAIARPDERSQLQIEAGRLAQLLDLAATESRMTGRYIAWTPDETGYRFWRRRADTGWSEIRDSDLLRPRTLPPGIAIASLHVESMRPQGAMRMEFNPYGQALAFAIELSSGAARYAVTGSPVGDVRAIPGEGFSGGAAAPHIP